MRVLRPFAAIVFVAAAAWPQPLSGDIDDIAIDAQGNILVAVTDLYQVLKIAPDGQVSVFAGTGRQRDYRDPGGDGGPAVAAELSKAFSVTVDPLTNEVYIADHYLVRKVDSNGIITTVVGTVEWGDGVARGEFAVEFALGYLRRIEFDPGSGKLYIAQENGRIWRVENGRIYHHAGSGEKGCGGDEGPAAEAQFGNLIDLAVSSEGSVYLADYDRRVYKVDPNGSTITAVMGNWRFFGGVIPDGTPALRTGIRRPRGLAVDSDNRLHFVGTHGAIYRLEEDGTLTLFSRLSDLLGESRGGRMVFDPVGNLILADNTRILEVSSDGRRVRTIVDLESDVVSALRSAGPAKSELSEYQRKIIDGREVAPGEWPFVARVGDSSGLCTGSLVAPNWILTAAHCLRDHDGSVTDPSDISVFLGYDWDKGVCENTREEIGRVIIHPDYYSAGAGFRNDAALVEILRPAAADPVKILTPGDEAWLAPSGTTATVIGWGRQIDGSYPRVLRTVDIPLMTPEDCRENSFWTSEVVHERTLCAGVEGRGIWSGDSGGPLVVSLPDGDWGQVGVTSMGGRARAGYPGVFTRTSSIYDWIHEQIDERVQAKDPDEVQVNVDAAVAAGGGLRAGGPPVTIDMSALFSFGDGGSADTTFTARSSHPAVVTADTTDGSLVLTPGDPAPITITITVTATRGDDTAEVEFTVEIEPEPPPPGDQTYYFPHLAVGASWQTTITYINYSPQEVTCQTDFLSDDGTPLMVSFAGLGTVDSRTDVLPPGGSVHQETNVELSAPLAPGWALANCSGPVQASLLFRGYDSEGMPVAEAGVNAATVPATRFVTFAEQGEGKNGTGVAYANPSDTAALVTFTARDADGEVLAIEDLMLPPNGHGAQNMPPLFDLSSFTGSLEITSTVPIVSLSLNFEAAPVFSSLPPGELDAAAQGSTTYYFPHLAVGASWQTTITYINYSREEVTCQTDFISDHGSPLMVSFAELGMVDSRTDVLPPGGSVHQETDVELSAPLAPGWAQATCTGPVQASLLFRQHSSEGMPVAEAGVNAATVPATRFVTFAEQGEGKNGTGVAYANPSDTAALVTFTARDADGEVLAIEDLMLPPNWHGAQNMPPLFDLSGFTGSLEITSTVPIVSLSLNFEAAPVFSSLPPGELDAAAQ